MTDNSCLQCHGTGWVLKKSKGRELAKRCQCYEKEKAQLLLEQANIPKRYKDCSFENFKELNESHKHALKISKKFVSNFPVQDIGLLYIGSCGVGKTHLAVAFIRELILKKEVPCYFCDFRELIRNIQSSYSPDSHLTESNILAPVFQNDVLLLDELGAGRTTAWVDETVFYVINNRYNNKKLTLFTSNYLDIEKDEVDIIEPFFKDQSSKNSSKKEDTLVDRIGIRLRSRLYEMCKIVEMSGKDFRKEIKQGSYRF